MNLRDKINEALTSGHLRTAPKQSGIVIASKPLRDLTKTTIRPCEHCQQPFAAIFSARYCSDECLYAANPDLVADRSEAITEEQRLEARWESKLPARQLGYDFQKLKPNSQRIARALSKRWEGGSLLLLGPSEGGKTFIAFRCARRAFMAGKAVRHDTAEGIRAKWLEDRKSLERCKTVEVLLIDDLGMENTTDGWTSAVYELLKAREDAELCTIVTANRTREYFGEKYSTAAANRLWRMEVVEL